METIDPPPLLGQRGLQRVDPPAGALALYLKLALHALGPLPLGNKPALSVFDLLPQRGDRAFQRLQSLPVIITVIRGSCTGNFANDLLDDTPGVRGGCLGPAPLLGQQSLQLVAATALGNQRIVRHPKLVP